jgi:two-component system, OmpR family, phosphate regulon response regulator PhoB
MCYNNNLLYLQLIKPGNVKRKVLIIENDVDIRNIVDFILAEEGFTTLSIPEPEAMDHILLFAPHVILIDEFINAKPGHRLCLKIKNTKELNNIPVIVLSTANNIELIATECQANDYIRKPFDVKEMVEKVVRIVGHQPLTC